MFQISIGLNYCSLLKSLLKTVIPLAVPDCKLALQGACSLFLSKAVRLLSGCCLEIQIKIWAASSLEATRESKISIIERAV